METSSNLLSYANTLFDSELTLNGPSALELSSQEDDQGTVLPFSTLNHANVEKESDETFSNLLRSRANLARGNSSTFRTLNGLFAVNNIMSPSSSRAESCNHSFQRGHHTRPGSSQMMSLSVHLFTRGLLDGRYSDIKVIAFGKAYPLHKLILDRVPFFSSALSGPWLEASSSEIKLHPEDIDSNITQKSFELMLKRLYGIPDPAEEADEVVGLFAIGCWLEMQDTIDASLERLLKNLEPDNVASRIRLVTNNFYGKAGERLLAATKAVLLQRGRDMQPELWDDIPSDIVREVLSSDTLFVYNERDRWNVACAVLDRKLMSIATELNIMQQEAASNVQAPPMFQNKAVRADSIELELPEGSEDYSNHRKWLELYLHPEIEPLFHMFDAKIYYMHLSFEELQFVKSTKDTFGVPILRESTISQALWKNLELRQKILNAKASSSLLGLMQKVPDASESSASPRLKRSSSHSVSSHTVSVALQRKLTSPARTSDMTDNEDDEAIYRRYWIPKTDCKYSLDEHDHRQYSRAYTSDTIIGSVSDQDITLPSLPLPKSSPPKQNTPPDSYTEFPPYRISVELPPLKFLKSTRPTYSRTFYYAGSVWNLYVRKSRAKAGTPELGVFLHRDSIRQGMDEDVDFETSVKASVDERIGALEREFENRNHGPRHLQRANQPNRPEIQLPEEDADVTGSTTIPRYPTRRPVYYSSEAQRAAMLAHRLSTQDATYSQSSEQGRCVLPQLRDRTIPTIDSYTDPRPVIKAYFKIFSPSLDFRSMTAFEGSPEDFQPGRGFGWNSTWWDEDGTNGREESDEDRFVNGKAPETPFQSAAEEGKSEKSPRMSYIDRWGRSSIYPSHGRLRFTVVVGVV